MSRLTIEAVQRFERSALVVLCLLAGACMVGTFAVAWMAPEFALLVPVALVTAGVGVALLRNERASLVTAIVGSAALFGGAGETGALEGLYYAFLLLYLVLWYGRRLGRSAIVEDSLDLLAGLVMGAAVLGFAFGQLYGAQLPVAFRETLSLLPIALFFPVRHLCTRQKDGVLWAGGSLIALGLSATAYTTYRIIYKLSSATAAWEILRVRAAGTEVQIVVALVLTAACLAMARRRLHVVSALVLLSILLGGLVLTKSRGYWVGAGFGLMIAWATARSGPRIRLMLRGSVAVIGLMAVGYLVVGSLFLTFVSGTLERAISVASAGTDPSLLNRYQESSAVWEGVRSAPIFGHGLGTSYTYYSIESGGSRTWSFIHNGFAALFFKQGVVGFVLTLGLWTVAAARAAVVARRASATSPWLAAASLGSAASLVGLSLTIYTSSPFYQMPIVIVTSVLIAMSSGAYSLIKVTNNNFIT